MSTASALQPSSLFRDLISGLVVFLIALPLCLGIALASGAPLVSGLLAGIIGGLVVGALSGSHTSVSGPAAGLTAVVAAQITSLGSFEAFLLAVLIAGVIQVGMGLLQAGQLATFAPSSVIRGLLAAIGIILILKQIPHLLGHDTDPEGEMAFIQPDNENTFTEIAALFTGEIHLGAAVIGVLSILLVVAWDKTSWLKKTQIPSPLIAVLFGLGLSLWFNALGGAWAVGATHRVQVPVMQDWTGIWAFFHWPDYSRLSDLAIYRSAMVLAIVASLETLLNLEAVDRLDPRQRNSPPNRELMAQGVGNICAGFVGALPLTSVIVRSSVNIHAGARSKLSAIFHGFLLAVCVAVLPGLLNQIPLSCLAAILIVTGFKLAGPSLFKTMWQEGRYQFLPFIITVLAIVFSDLLIGVLIGLAVSLSFILNSNFRRPLRTILEKHIGGDVLRVELANQVSFLNRGAIDKVFNQLKAGDHVLIDATSTDYVDPDVLAMIRDYTSTVAPARGVNVSHLGFRNKYQFKDEIQFVDYSSRELQQEQTPQKVLRILLDGNERFRKGTMLRRDVQRQLQSAAVGQHPLAVVLSCIDSRTPAEVIFDLGLGDIFSVRIAGNVISERILGSMEYSCAVAGAKLVLVIGHTRCGAVGASVDLALGPQPPTIPAGCGNLAPIVHDIMESVDVPRIRRELSQRGNEAKAELIDDTARRNVLRSVSEILHRSEGLRRLSDEGKIAVVGAMYDVSQGVIEILTDHELLEDETRKMLA